MENKTRKLGFLKDTGKGITLGISVAIPGLSAGTIAVAWKCYDTIIDSIQGLKSAFRKNFLTLLPYVLGLLLGAIAAFIGIQKGYSKVPFSITGLFAGLVIGSLPVALQELKKHQNRKELLFHLLSLILCFVIAAGLGLFTALFEVDLSAAMKQREWWIYLIVLLSGVIGAFACIVPGISGSMSLMVIGMYVPILNTFATTKGELSIFNSTNGGTGFLLTGLLLLLLLLVGAIIGLALSTRIMKKLLADHRVTTFYGILGLIIGSVISMFVNSTMFPLYRSGGIRTWDYIVGSILFVVIAVVMILVLNRKKKTEESAK